MRVYDTNVTIYQQEKQDLLDFCDKSDVKRGHIYINEREGIQFGEIRT